MMSVRAVAAAVELSGVERARFLAEIGADVSRLDDVHARVSLAEYDRVIDAALAHSGDPALGLHMGERLAACSFDVLLPFHELSGSLREALETAGRYARIVNECRRLEIRERGDGVLLACVVPESETPGARFAIEFGMTVLLRLVRSFVGEEAQPRRVSFAYPPPAHCAEYTRVFGGREVFSQRETGMELERAWLDRTRASRACDLREFLRTRADLLLARADRSAPAADRTRSWLDSHAGPERPTMDRAARDLGMSARSLRRRLQDEGASFQALLEESLASRAKRLLSQSSGSVQGVASAMGFSTQSAFAHAFKRWTGITPTAFRAAR